MIYLLYGEDEYLRNEYLKKIKKSFGILQLGINYVQIDENNVNQIISDIETPAFGFETKLILAKDTGLFKKKNAFSDTLAEYLKNNKVEGVELVFVENEAEKNSLYNTIQKIGEVKEFKEQKLPQLITKVKSIANAYNVNIKDKFLEKIHLLYNILLTLKVCENIIKNYSINLIKNKHIS